MVEKLSVLVFYIPNFCLDVNKTIKIIVANNVPNGKYQSVRIAIISPSKYVHDWLVHKPNRKINQTIPRMINRGPSLKTFISSL